MSRMSRLTDTTASMSARPTVVREPTLASWLVVAFLVAVMTISETSLAGARARRTRWASPTFRNRSPSAWDAKPLAVAVIL